MITSISSFLFIILLATAVLTIFPTFNLLPDAQSEDEEGGDDSSSDEGGDDSSSDEGGDDSSSDEGGDDSSSDEGGDDSSSDEGGDDSSSDEGGDDGQDASDFFSAVNEGTNDEGGDDSSSDEGGDDGQDASDFFSAVNEGTNDEGGDDNGNVGGNDDKNTPNFDSSNEHDITPNDLANTIGSENIASQNPSDIALEGLASHPSDVNTEDFTSGDFTRKGVDIVNPGDFKEALEDHSPLDESTTNDDSESNNKNEGLIGQPANAEVSVESNLPEKNENKFTHMTALIGEDLKKSTPEQITTYPWNDLANNDIDLTLQYLTNDPINLQKVLSFTSDDGIKKIQDSLSLQTFNKILQSIPEEERSKIMDKLS